MSDDEEYDKWEKALIEYQKKAKRFYDKNATIKILTG